MKIAASNLSMDAVSSYTEVWQANIYSGRGGRQPAEGQELFKRAMRANAPLADNREIENNAGNTGSLSVNNMPASQDIPGHESVVEDVVSNLVGSGVRVAANRDAGEVRLGGNTPGGGFSTGSASRLQVGISTLYCEKEELRFCSQGSITAGDGRVVNFEMELALERTEIHRTTVSLDLGDVRFIDPLVLSFENGLSVLGDSSFEFDLDSDGQLDTIAGLRQGSGYLVLDKNGDGRVNNGSELFGPLTNSGFGELVIYDDDANNWIDENDPVFDRLQIWMGADGGDQQLISLREAGVGALSLAAADTLFNLKDGNGRITGQLSGAGLFLTESGEPRPLLEVDLGILGNGEEKPQQRPVFPTEIEDLLGRLEQMIAERRRRFESRTRLGLAGLFDEERKDWFLNRFNQSRV